MEFRNSQKNTWFGKESPSGPLRLEGFSHKTNFIDILEKQNSKYLPAQHLRLPFIYLFIYFASADLDTSKKSFLMEFLFVSYLMYVGNKILLQSLSKDICQAWNYKITSRGA